MGRKRIYDKLLSVNFKLEPSQYASLEKEAKRRKISMSALIRELIETAIKGDEKREDENE